MDSYFAGVIQNLDFTEECTVGKMLQECTVGQMLQGSRGSYSCGLYCDLETQSPVSHSERLKMQLKL